MAVRDLDGKIEELIQSWPRSPGAKGGCRICDQ